jgi:NitT/TauT family transport system permease protein/taurine transport system permease protein
VRHRRLWVGLASLVVLAAAWYVLTTVTGAIGGGRFPSPGDVWKALRQIALAGYADAKLHEHVLHSLKLVILGFVVAVSVGVPLGVAMGWSRRAEAFLNPIFSLLRPIPPLAWIPLAIVWLGLGDAAKVLVIFVAAFVPAVINSYTGVRTIEPYIIEAARMLDVGRTAMVREVIVPGAMPMIFTGLRLSLQASWTTLVAAELVGALAGLGRVLNVAAQDIYPGMIFVGMAMVAIFGGLTTRLLGVAEARTLRWMHTR